MAGRYIDVMLGEKYFKKMFLSMGVTIDNKDLTEFEIDYSETWAENQIDSILGVRFPDLPATPLLIRDIAMALCAFKLRQFLLTANAPNLDAWTNQIKEEAFKEIDDIFHGRKSVIMPDLTFHPMYPGPSGGERFTAQPESSLRLFFTNMNRDWFEMRQAAEKHDGDPIDGVEDEYRDRSYGDPLGFAIP